MTSEGTKISVEDAKVQETEYSPKQSSTPTLTESTDNMSMNLSSNTSSSTLRENNNSRQLYHNYEEKSTEHQTEQKINSIQAVRDDVGQANKEEKGINELQNSRSSNEQLQASQSSHQTSHSSSSNYERRRPRSGSGGSTKSSAFALDIIRRSRNNNGSSSSYASALTDEMWINDWSHHSTGSQMSFLSMSSVQSRRQNPMLSRRSGSASSSWASLEGLDSQSLHSDKSKNSHNRKNANHENIAKQEKQKRINQHREDAVKNYHLNNDFQQQNSRNKHMIRSKSLPGQSLPKKSNNHDLETSGVCESQDICRSHEKRTQHELLNSDLDTTFHAGQFVPTGAVKKSMNTLRLPPTQYLDPKSKYIPGSIEWSQHEQAHHINAPIEYSDASTRSNASNPYPMAANGRQRVRQLSQPLMSVMINERQVPRRQYPYSQNYSLYGPNETMNRAQQYQNFQGDIITINNEEEERILHSHGKPRYRMDDPSKAKNVYRHNRPDSFESFSGTYEYEQHYQSPKPKQYLYPNHQFDSMQPYSAPLPQSQMTDPLYSENSVTVMRQQAEIPFMNASKSKVSFSTVSVRHYNRILGDNPSCSNGPSLSIGWKYYVGLEDCPVDEYENSRFYNRRHDHNIILPRSERESILIDLGYQQNEIARAVRANVKAKSRRRRTVHNLAFSKVEESIESIRKKVTSAVRIGKKKKEKSLSGVECYGIADMTGSDSHQSSSSFTTQNSKGDDDIFSSEFDILKSEKAQK